MSATRRYPPNKLLAWQRLQRGWGRDELARQIKTSMAAHGETDTGLDASTVRRWEAGERWPEPRFRKHLVLLFGLRAQDLGLLTAEELACCPEPPRTVSAASAVDDDVVDTVLRKVLPMIQGDCGGVSRQVFLRALLAAGLTPTLDSHVTSAGRRATLGRDPETVAAYDRITATQRGLYWSSPPRALLDASVAHTRLGCDLMSTAAATGAGRRDLAKSVALSALLTARLAHFDLGHADLAQRAFTLATDAVEEADDHALAAAVAAHRAFVPGFAGDAPAAQGFLDAAHAHARYGAGPQTRAWLHCVTAEIHARTGQQRSSRDRIRQAQESLTTTGTDPLWLDFFDQPRLAGFAGNVELLAGRPEAAIPWLTRALEGNGAAGDKQRSVLLLDLAAAHAQRDPDHAATVADEALSVLEKDFYLTGYQRIAHLRVALAGTRHATELADRAHQLPRLIASP